MHSSLLILSTLFSLALTKANLPTTILVAYWGQSSEQSLQTYCQLGYFNVINLAFVYKFGTNPIAFQTEGCSSVTGYGSGCADLGSQIQVCQSLGIKILVSLGGATVYDCGQGGCQGNYSFTSTSMAAATGTQIWQTFFNAGKTTSGVPRPFPGVTLDGIDLDIEMKQADNGQASQLYYDTFVKTLTNYDSNLIVGAAPECMEGDLGTNTMANIVATVPLDFMFVQFFNNPYCAISGQGFPGYFAYWAGVAEKAGARLLIGVPGDNSAGASLSSSYWIPAPQLLTLVASMKTAYPGANIGVGMYDAGTAVGSTSSGADPNYALKVHAGLTGTSASVPAVVSAASPAILASASVAIASSGAASSTGSVAPSSTDLGVISTGMPNIVGNLTIIPSMSTSAKLPLATTNVTTSNSTSNSTTSTTAKPTSAGNNLFAVSSCLIFISLLGMLTV